MTGMFSLHLDFIVLTVRIISVLFRYIYSTDFICRQGVDTKSSRETFIFTESSWLVGLIV